LAGPMVVENEEPMTGKLAQELVPAIARWLSGWRRRGKRDDERVGALGRSLHHVLDIDLGREHTLTREVSGLGVFAIAEAHRPTLVAISCRRARDVCLRSGDLRPVAGGGAARLQAGR